MPEAEKIQDANNIGVAKGRPGGYAVVAPAGIDLAKFKDVAKTLKELIAEMAASGVKSLGYISSDGITWSTDVDSEDNNDWGGDVIDSTMNSYSESAKVTWSVPERWKIWAMLVMFAPCSIEPSTFGTQAIA